MEILIFGGSFDPPHRGHLALLKVALKTLKPERAYVVPAFHSPLKPLSATPGKERLALVKAALQDGLGKKELDRVRAHSFELARGRKTFAFETVRFFSRLHPGARVHSLIGSDSLESFPRWKRAAELCRTCRFLVGRRPGVDPVEGCHLPPVSLLPGSFPDISSTELRARLLAAEDARDHVCGAVLRVIGARGLYGGRIRAELSGMLKPERYRHTLCVAQRARRLARRHGLDEEKAALAGLLHDCGKSLSSERKIALLRRARASVPAFPETARRSPGLLHAHASAALAERRFGVSDPEVLSAIRKHTLGDLDMSPLDLLLYVADASSSDRDFPEVDSIRRAAKKGLEAGFHEALRVKLAYVLKEGGWMHPLGPRLWNQGIR